jgi:sugar diacid utilization regulator
VNVPYHAIIDLLLPYAPVASADQPQDGAYVWVEHLTEEADFVSKDTIYVAAYSVLREIRIPDGFLCICLDESERFAAQEKKPRNCVLIWGAKRPGEIVRLIRDYILELQAWDKTTMEYVLKKELHHLITLGGEFIGNTILLYNDNFRLLAFYGINPNDNQYYSNLIQSNLSRDDFENDFADADLALAHWPDIVDDEDGGKDLASEKLIARTIFVEKAAKGQIYMVCRKDTQTQGRLELFERLFEKVLVFFEREAPVVQPSRNVDAFLLDLIENRITDPVTVDNRADYCGIPTEQLYCLFLIRFKYYFKDIESIQLLKQLSARLPGARLLVYGNSILVINYYVEKTSRSESETWVDAIKDILKEYKAEMGISMPEDSIRNLPLSYKRAVLAIEYGSTVHKKLAVHHIRGEQLDIFRYDGYDIYAYETYYIYHIIDLMLSENRTILESSFCMRSLAKLYSFDQENKMDNLKLLYTYLINERSATKTAAIMHMHRNNVLYRINKIEQLLEVDLNEYQYRFKFLLSYRVLDFYGPDYLNNINYSSIGLRISKKKEK